MIYQASIEYLYIADHVARSSYIICTKVIRIVRRRFSAQYSLADDKQISEQD